VAKHFEERGIVSPEVKVMVSGDSWSSDAGFDIKPNDFFENREKHLREYGADNRERLEKFYAKEAEGHISPEDVQRYFSKFSRAVPWPIRRYFKGAPIHYVLTAGDRIFRIAVDLHRGTATADLPPVGASHPIEIHTSVYVFRQCMLLNLFSHLSISKRVRYRVISKRKRHVQVLNLLFNLYEYDMIPVRRMFTRRFVGVWLRRWREWSLYARIAASVALRREFKMSRYLPAPRAHKDLSAARP
jgi:UDP-MurNAc hydroxylase